MSWRRRVLIGALLGAILLPLSASAQRGRGFGGGGGGRQMYYENPPYDGRFIFTRVRYNGGFMGGMSQAWNHDYPRADLNLPLILREVTAIPANTERSQILTLEDPEIFRNPIIYMWEPGFWRANEAEAKNLRDYLLKGGLIIFDDFEEDHLYNMQAQFARAIPNAEWIKLDLSHPVYHSFFDMAGIHIPHPSQNVPTPGYYGVHADNDPSKRLIAIANHNSDVAEYWEWSGTGQFAVDTTNDAYKLGANYFIYGMTH
jgi:Domain of unknown function (DUF4159)